MRKPEPKLEIKDFQQALKLAEEFEVDGFANFIKTHGENGLNSLENYFASYLFRGNKEKQKEFFRLFFGQGLGGVDCSFFYALEKLGKLPKEYKPILLARIDKNEKILQLLPLLGGWGVGEKELLPRTVLLPKTHLKPLAEQIKIVNHAYDWALKNIPLEQLTARVNTLSSEEGKTRLKKFISEKKRFMARQRRFRQRRLRVKKGEGSLKPKRSLRR